MADDRKVCPFCAELIQQQAIKCHYCGEFLTDADQGEFPRHLQLVRCREFSPGLALVLGLLFTGFGQFYTERIAAGIGFMLLALCALLCGLVGPDFFFLLIPIVQLAAAWEAYHYNPAAALAVAPVNAPAEPLHTCNL